MKINAVAGAALAVGLLAASASHASPAEQAADYARLLEIFGEFREFSESETSGDLTDYGAAMADRLRALRQFQARLAALDVDVWPVAEQVDYHLVRGEMNGLEFALRVVRRWERDPGFYSLSRAGLGAMPTLPMTAAQATDFGAILRAVPGFFETARENLGRGTVAGIAGDFALLTLRTMTPAADELAAGLDRVTRQHPDLASAAAAANASVRGYLDWLTANRDAMTEPAGVGLDNYNWLLKNVYLFPYTWEESRTIVHMEDNRVVALLRLEQNRNRDVPALQPVQSQADYRRSVLEALDTVDRFIREQEIYTVPDYLVDDEYRQGRLAATSGPWPERHDYFFTFSHREPLMEETHELIGHHYDLLRQQHGTHPIRNKREHEGPYHQSVARWEGLAFAYEELLMHAGYLDDRSPHGREIVYEQAAFRTVRALSDLYQHAREWDIAEAFEYSIANAPYGERLRGTRHLWNEVADTNLRMVGWHTQMVVGKVQFMKLLRDRSQQLGDDFVMKDFMDEFYAMGALPISLIRWQMTGYEDEIHKLW
jgi:hypothetical protein